MEVAEITIAGIGAVPLIMALVELVKRVGLPSQFAPFAAIILGVGVISLMQGVSSESAMAGLVMGLSASGLWSAGGGTVVKKVL